MEPKPSTEVFNREIAELEAKLASKKQELMQSGVETPEKHIFKEVIREHAFMQEGPTAVIPTNSTAPASSTPTRTATAEEESQLNLFVAHAFTKGLASAISEARKTNNAYFIDMLHDRLADEYYTRLVQARKIKA